VAAKVFDYIFFNLISLRLLLYFIYAFYARRPFVFGDAVEMHQWGQL